MKTIYKKLLAATISTSDKAAYTIADAMTAERVVKAIGVVCLLTLIGVVVK